MTGLLRRHIRAADGAPAFCWIDADERAAVRAFRADNVDAPICPTCVHVLLLVRPFLKIKEPA